MERIDYYNLAEEKTMISKVKKLFFIATIFLIFMCGSSSAATITVPSDYPTIQIAIDNAAAGDTVLVLEGTYGEDITMRDEIDLIGEEHKLVTIIGTVATADNTELRGFTIQGGADEPVINVSSINTLIEKCVVKSLDAGTGSTGLGIMVNRPSGFADFNLDGTVNDYDLALLLSSFGMTGMTFFQGDANNDGTVNDYDLALLLSSFGMTYEIPIRNTVIHVGNHTGYDRGVYLNQAGPVLIESNTIHVDANPDAVHSEDTACIYSKNGSSYTLRNNILTLNDTALNAINSNSDTIEVVYNCILGKISPLTLRHKGTIFASPGYKDLANGDFHLAMAVDNKYRSPTITLDSGDPLSDFSGEIQYKNKAIDLGAYGNTRDTVITTFAGDFNLDGIVDGCDLSLLLTNWRRSGMSYFQGDATGDGIVNGNDLSILLANFRRSYF